MAVTVQSKSVSIPESGGYGLCLPAEGAWEKTLEFLSGEDRGKLVPFLKAHFPKPKAGQGATFDLGPQCRVRVVLVGKVSSHRRLSTARRLVAPLLLERLKEAWVDLRAVDGVELWAEAVASAVAAAQFKMPRYRTETTKPPKPNAVHLVVPPAAASSVAVAVERGEALTEGTNRVRQLAALPGNELTTAHYVEMAQDWAKEAGLKTEFYSFDRLKKMGAGAFCAVAQASRGGSGILRIDYLNKGPRVAWVGKGITFDTGGAQLKTGEYMFGMHGDMAGSAVALALILWAKRVKAPFSASSYLAITDNQLSPESFRPNDVVKTLSGKTIEVVDTDAEGRMILSDTLTLASRGEGGKGPDFLMDFATLTGSCVRAIGTRYSGGYANRKWLLNLVNRAGRESGERVWAFPNDADYGKCLKSQIADLKQCRVKGGVDHIEASYFLRQFVEKSVPYVHVDLSAMDCEGGLAHVPTEVTGFGVRFASSLTALALDRLSRGK